MKQTASAIEILKAEHDAILEACRAIDETAASLLRRQPVAPEALFEHVRFFWRYVDVQHRRKDQDFLFPMLERKQIGTDVVDRSLMDYEEGRWWIRSLDQLAEAYSLGCATAGRRWAETSRNYAQMLRAQIEAESRIFPLVEHELSDREQCDLADAYA